MKIRRFFSHNVRSALKQVTEVFGNEAAILSNKKVPGGVEIIAALDYDESLMPANSEAIESVQPDISANLQLDNENKSTPMDIKQDDATSKEEFSEARLKKIDVIASHKKAKVEWSLDPSLQAMKEELELMRAMMAEQLNGIAWNRFTEKDPLKAMIMRRLSELGLNYDVINLLLPQVDKKQDIECCWQKILVTLAKSLPVANNELLQQGGIYAFLGPTGVGKTTTIAKLAARFVIKHGCDSVALISTDNYRITAQEQLTTFGRILKIPTACVTEKSTLEFLLKKFADKKLILIDTAGISSNDSVLNKQLDAINNSHKPIRKLLLMSATSQVAVLHRSLKLFSLVSLDALVITKLDEATSLGEILSVVLNASYPVIYTTDGQKIPEDIRVAKSYHLISKAVWLANKYSRETEEWRLAQSVELVKSA